MYKKFMAVTAFTLLAAHAHSNAITDEGTIHFGPYSDTPPGATATITLDDAQTTAYVSYDPSAPNKNAQVTYVEGIFTDTFNNKATFNDFAIGAEGTLLGHTLWNEESGWSLTIDTVENRSLMGVGTMFVEIGASGDATIEKGDISIAGFWSLSMDTSDIPIVSSTGARQSEGIKFAFSSTATADVPEPGSLALLCVGVVGLVVSRRRQAA